MGSIILNIRLSEKHIHSFRLYFSFLLGLVIFLLPVNAQSQITKIIGKVVDNGTNEPIPFANILILRLACEISNTCNLGLSLASK